MKFQQGTDLKYKDKYHITLNVMLTLRCTIGDTQHYMYISSPACWFILGYYLTKSCP